MFVCADMREIVCVCVLVAMRIDNQRLTFKCGIDFLELSFTTIKNIQNSNVDLVSNFI